MVKLNKIYTRTGDLGTTSLANGTKVGKDNLRVETYGTLDEANAFIGLARCYTNGEAKIKLGTIQNDLFDLGADLAQPGKDLSRLRISQIQVDKIENDIDQYNLKLQPLNSFILPGGTKASAYLHVARSVVRRGERLAVNLSCEEEINPIVIIYLNRLSDYLFIFARHLNNDGALDILWEPGSNQT